ncbi:homeobox protein 2 [Stomoxys calcitrans]|uniref:homeobox protein 2 n=1 Tax=Stomoxys calcitrans TaxID=35570 RepID=UPI0027E35ED7|nr:homeobox protein 2 [Stomoxys calcitrans]
MSGRHNSSEHARNYKDRGYRRDRPDRNDSLEKYDSGWTKEGKKSPPYPRSKDLATGSPKTSHKRKAYGEYHQDTLTKRPRIDATYDQQKNFKDYRRTESNKFQHQNNNLRKESEHVFENAKREEASNLHQSTTVSGAVVKTSNIPSPYAHLPPSPPRLVKPVKKVNMRSRENMETYLHNKEECGFVTVNASKNGQGSEDNTNKTDSDTLTNSNKDSQDYSTSLLKPKASSEVSAENKNQYENANTKLDNNNIDKIKLKLLNCNEHNHTTIQNSNNSQLFPINLNPQPMGPTIDGTYFNLTNLKKTRRSRFDQQPPLLLTKDAQFKPPKQPIASPIDCAESKNNNIQLSYKCSNTRSEEPSKNSSEYPGIINDSIDKYDGRTAQSFNTNTGLIPSNNTYCHNMDWRYTTADSSISQQGTNHFKQPQYQSYFSNAEIFGKNANGSSTATFSLDYGIQNTKEMPSPLMENDGKSRNVVNFAHHGNISSFKSLQENSPALTKPQFDTPGYLTKINNPTINRDNNGTGFIQKDWNTNASIRTNKPLESSFNLNPKDFKSENAPKTYQTLESDRSFPFKELSSENCQKHTIGQGGLNAHKTFEANSNRNAQHFSSYSQHPASLANSYGALGQNIQFGMRRHSNVNFCQQRRDAHFNRPYFCNRPATAKENNHFNVQQLPNDQALASSSGFQINPRFIRGIGSGSQNFYEDINPAPPVEEKQNNFKNLQVATHINSQQASLNQNHFTLPGEKRNLRQFGTKKQSRYVSNSGPQVSSNNYTIQGNKKYRTPKEDKRFRGKHNNMANNRIYAFGGNAMDNSNQQANLYVKNQSLRFDFKKHSNDINNGKTTTKGRFMQKFMKRLPKPKDKPLIKSTNKLSTNLKEKKTKKNVKRKLTDASKNTEFQNNTKIEAKEHLDINKELYGDFQPIAVGLKKPQKGHLKPEPEIYWRQWWSLYGHVEKTLSPPPLQNDDAIKSYFSFTPSTTDSQLRKRKRILLVMGVAKIMRHIRLNEKDYAFRDIFSVLKYKHQLENPQFQKLLSPKELEKVEMVLKNARKKTRRAFFYQSMMCRWHFSMDIIKRSENGEAVKSGHARKLLSNNVFHYLVWESTKELKKLITEDWPGFEEFYKTL